MLRWAEIPREQPDDPVLQPLLRAVRERKVVGIGADPQLAGLGRIGQDQVADYARRKGWTLKEAERWLSPNLGYEPED